MSNDSNILIVSDSEHLTILNALRFWQAAGRPVFPEIMQDQTSEPLPEHDLYPFIDRISTNVYLAVLLTSEHSLQSDMFLSQDDISAGGISVESTSEHQHSEAAAA